MKTSTSERILLSILLVFIFLFIFFRYYGLGAVAHQDIYQFILDEKLYGKDIYLQNTFYINSSVFSNFVKITGLSPDNDLIGFTYHLCFSSISIYYFYKILRNFTIISNNYDQLMVVIGFLTLDHIILQEAKSSLIYINEGFSTAYGHSLIFPLIYYTLKNKVLHVAIINSIMFMLSIKAGLFPAVLCWSYLVFYSRSREEIIRLIYVSLPLATAFFMSKGASLQGGYEEKIQMVHNAMMRTKDEDVFHFQPYKIFITFLFSFIIYFLNLAYFPEKQQQLRIYRFLKVVVVLSGSLAFFGYLYAVEFYKYYPDPRLIMLSAVRSMAVYQMCLILGLVVVLFSKNLHPLIKMLFIASISFWDIKYNYTYKLVWVAEILWSVIAVYLILNNIESVKSKLSRLEISKNAIIILFIWLMSINVYQGLSKSNMKNFSYNQNRYIGKWYSQLNKYPEMETALIKMRNCPDFIMHTLIAKTGNKEIQSVTYGNYLSQKSKYLGDLYNLVLNPEMHNIAVNRNKNMEDAISSLNEINGLTIDQVNQFELDELTLVTNLNPNKYNFHTKDIIKFNQNTWIIKFYPEEQIKQCIERLI